MPENLLALEEILQRVDAGLAAGLNRAALAIYRRSQTEVPKSEKTLSGEEGRRHELALADSGLHPGNEPAYAATPGKLAATVAYIHPAAAAQHEGHMVYERHGKEVEWQVHRHSMPGTKTKFLEDPFKAMLPQVEALCSAEVAAALEGTRAPEVTLRVETSSRPVVPKAPPSGLAANPETIAVARASAIEVERAGGAAHEGVHIPGSIGL